MENRKIRNATPTQISNIKFKSLFESIVYKALVQKGFEPLYEGATYTIIKGEKPKDFPMIFEPTKSGLLSHSCTKIRDITYTPDFVINHKNWTILIEVKGFENDVFPIKKKLFKMFLNTLPDERYMFFIIKNSKQLKQCLGILEDFDFDKYNIERDGVR